MAENFNSNVEDLIIAKSVKVAKFNKITNLSNTFRTKILTDESNFPEEEREKLRKWKETHKQPPSEFDHHEKLHYTIEEIIKHTEEESGIEFFTVKAYINQFSPEVAHIYEACIKDDCGKRAFQNEDGIC